jgi:threonine synthase
MASNSDRATLQVESYTSTRNPDAPVTFGHAVTSGYAADRGLYVPSSSLPLFTPSRLSELKNMSFDNLAFAILRRFIPLAEMTDAELTSIIERSYSAFTSPTRVNVVKPADSPFCISELFHGPTYCFKDFGLSMLANLVSHFTPPSAGRRTLCVSTTGDTGPAAVAAVVSTSNPSMNIITFYPQGQISPFQRNQMVRYSSHPSVKVVEFVGGGDDMDQPLKNLQQDPECTEAGICGANSYNVARPLAQLVHFFWSVFRSQEHYGLNDTAPVDIIIPTGAMGNIAACYIAKNCGLPVGMITAATNANDITHRCFSAGDFSKSEAMAKTLSDAINIQVPYNMERLLFFASGSDHSKIAELYKGMEETDSIQIDADFLAKLKTEFRSARVDDDAMCEAMRDYKRDHDYLCDPHTAVAVGAAKSLGYYSPGSSPVCIMATASPCKFEESVTIAVGEEIWKEYRTGPSYPKDTDEGGDVEAVYERGDSEEATIKSWMAKTKTMLI